MSERLCLAEAEEGVEVVVKGDYCWVLLYDSSSLSPHPPHSQLSCKTYAEVPSA